MLLLDMYIDLPATFKSLFLIDYTIQSFDVANE